MHVSNLGKRESLELVRQQVCLGRMVMPFELLFVAATHQALRCAFSQMCTSVVGDFSGYGRDDGVTQRLVLIEFVFGMAIRNLAGATTLQTTTTSTLEDCQMHCTNASNNRCGWMRA